MQRYPMTPEGHKALEDELKQLKTVERPRITTAIAEAREHGDLKENAEYHAAVSNKGFVKLAFVTSKPNLAGLKSSTLLNCPKRDEWYLG